MDKKSLVNVFTGCGLFGFSVIALQSLPILDDPDGARGALAAQGLEPLEVGGGVWFGQGEKRDFWKTKFVAIDADSECVQGYTTGSFTEPARIRDSRPVPCPEDLG